MFYEGDEFIFWDDDMATHRLNGMRGVVQRVDLNNHYQVRLVSGEVGGLNGKLMKPAEYKVVNDNKLWEALV